MNPQPPNRQLPDVATGRRVGELLHCIELASVTPHGDHALAQAPVSLTPHGQCTPGHDGCLNLHCRANGRYLRLHLTRTEARQLAHLLYYRTIADPLRGDPPDPPDGW